MTAAEPEWGFHLLLSHPEHGSVFFCPPSCVAGCWISLHPAGDNLDEGSGWEGYSPGDARFYQLRRRGDVLDLEVLPLPSSRLCCELREGFRRHRDLSWALALLHPRSRRKLRSGNNPRLHRCRG